MVRPIFPMQCVCYREEATLPAAFVAALLARKTQPLRLWRRHRAMTLEALGKIRGVTHSALSQLGYPRVHRTADLNTIILSICMSSIVCGMPPTPRPEWRSPANGMPSTRNAV